MFGIKKKSPVATAELDAPNTIIGKGISIEGASMSGNESVRIEGEFKGDINLEGSLVLGEHGVINGDVVANYFLVAGEVNGNIECKTQLHFASTAKVAGDIFASSLIVDEGSIVTGAYTIGNKNNPTLLHAPPDIITIESSDKND